MRTLNIYKDGRKVMNNYLQLSNDRYVPPSNVDTIRKIALIVLKRYPQLRHVVHNPEQLVEITPIKISSSFRVGPPSNKKYMIALQIMLPYSPHWDLALEYNLGQSTIKYTTNAVAQTIITAYGQNVIGITVPDSENPDEPVIVRTTVINQASFLLRTSDDFADYLERYHSHLPGMIWGPQ